MQITDSIKHENWHVTVDISIDLKLVVNFLIEDDIFSFKPSYGTKNTKFTDFFFAETGEFASYILINEYLILTAQGN